MCARCGGPQGRQYGLPDLRHCTGCSADTSFKTLEEPAAPLSVDYSCSLPPCQHPRKGLPAAGRKWPASENRGCEDPCTAPGEPGGWSQTWSTNKGEQNHVYTSNSRTASGTGKREPRATPNQHSLQARTRPIWLKSLPRKLWWILDSRLTAVLQAQSRFGSHDGQRYLPRCLPRTANCLY